MKDNIEELIAKKINALEEQDGTDTSALWGKLNEQLNKDVKKRPWQRWVAAAAVLLLAGVTALLLLNNTAQQKSKTYTAVPATQQRASTQQAITQENEQATGNQIAQQNPAIKLKKKHRAGKEEQIEDEQWMGYNCGGDDPTANDKAIAANAPCYKVSDYQELYCY